VAKKRNWPTDRKEFYKACADAGVVAKLNHPGDGNKSHGGLAYSEIGDKVIQMISLLSPKEEAAYVRALDNGWHLAPDGSDVTGDCRTWTGILATGLSREAIWDAMRNRRVYSTQDRNCKLSFRINGAEMGSIVTEPTESQNVAIGIWDPDKGDDVAKIELFENGELYTTLEEWPKVAAWCMVHPYPKSTSYYFVKVTQADGDLLWSAPVWLMVGAP
jgi:hypothetical protein